jgi:uncharacterized membrane protein
MMQALPHRRGQYSTRNVNQALDEQLSFGDHLSESLARVGGSWGFIVGFCGALAVWVGLNSLQLLLTPFDPYPFILLNLVLSCLAAVQAPIILMSQNRQAARDRIAAELDYACNLRAEVEVEELHEKVDLLRGKQWLDLVELQQHQIILLNRLLEERGLVPPPTPPGDGPGTVVPFSTARHGLDGRAPRRPRVVSGQCHRRPGPGPSGA